jgi:hypothetical protein
MMVNNSTNINDMNSWVTPQIIEHKKKDDNMMREYPGPALG